MRKRLALAAISAAIALPVVGGGTPPTSATAAPVATASCVDAKTPGGIKCLQPGEFCSHKPGYARAYKRAGFRCNREGRLEYR